MTAYSMTEAGTELPRLVQQAVEGEEVLILRDGQPVVVLQPVTLPSPSASAYAWLRARRQSRKAVGIASVDLLNQMYVDPPV